MLYYMYEEEKDQYPKAPKLDRSLRALSSRRRDEGSQEGSEQEGMPWKGARMKVGDLVRHLKSEGGMLGIIVGWHRQTACRPSPIVCWNDGRTSWVLQHLVKVVA